MISRPYAYESTNIINGQVGDPKHNVVRNIVKATGNGNVNVSVSRGNGSVNAGNGTVHITDPRGEVLVNKNKVMIRTPDGKIVQVQNGQIQISGKGHVFNNGNVGSPPSVIPDVNSLVSEIMTFVQNLLNSIFGPPIPAPTTNTA